MQVIKRNGSIQPFDINKVLLTVERTLTRQNTADSIGPRNIGNVVTNKLKTKLLIMFTRPKLKLCHKKHFRKWALHLLPSIIANLSVIFKSGSAIG